MFTPSFRIVIAFLSLAAFGTQAMACPFCTPGQTLLGEVGQADLIIFGTLSNAKRDPNDFSKGTTDMEIELIVKDHDFLKGKKSITLPRYVPSDPKNKSKHLVFCEIYKGQLDPYRGEAVPQESKIAEYLKGAIALKAKPGPEKLLYFYKHFDSSDWSVSADAFQEFSNADYTEIRPVAEKMEADRIIKMLKDPNTSAARYGLLGLLVGHCGKPETHAKQLREFLDQPKVREATGLDGLLTGYIMLDQKEGTKFVNDLIKNTKEDFLIRYAALRCLRFCWDYRTDIISKDAIISAVKPLIAQADIADLAIEDLRKWQRWEMASELIDLFGKSSHDIPIIQRSIIKFALTAPADNKVTGEFLKKLRADASQSERVKDLEQLLELEKPRPAQPAAKEEKK
ncbi:hypothetical protein [Zavarzinella formosa]|uniref:hypothetical protein n=1 Tax=Zavarzinella formosa TaxID=360055 RepID=UPI0002D52C38|nr:hypothetical protein [Zavarzinella formosa]